MLGGAPRTNETLSDFFVKIWIPINRTQQFDIGSPEIHMNSAGYKRDPRIWGITDKY